MIRTVKQVSLGVIAALALLALVTVAQEAHEDTAQAVTLEVGVDVNASGNDATTVGAVDTCRTVSFFQTFDIDLYFKNGISNVVAVDMWFQYDATILEIQSYQIMFQDDPPSSSITDATEILPDTFEPGVFHIGAVETGESQGDTGLEGVFFRLSVKAIANGLSAAKISQMDLDNDGAPDRGITLTNSSTPPGFIGDVNGDSLYDGTVVNSAVFVGTGTCGGDSDGDGIDDILDNCPSTANPGQEDWNFDGIGDACQDFDGDGVGDDTDNCPGVANAGQEDGDSDGIGDACDNDRDGDGVANTSDNCPDTPNAGQSDIDADGLGDACDDDMDGDNWPNTAETSLTTDPAIKCPATGIADGIDNNGDTVVDEATEGSHDETTDAWPPDFDDNQEVSILDVLALKPVFLSNAGDGTYVVRKDISPQSGPDGTINILDVLALKTPFLTNCITGP